MSGAATSLEGYPGPNLFVRTQRSNFRSFLNDYRTSHGRDLFPVDDHCSQVINFYFRLTDRWINMRLETRTGGSDERTMIRPVTPASGKCCRVGYESLLLWSCAIQ